MANTTGGKIAVNNGKIKKFIKKSELKVFLNKHPDWSRGYPYKKHRPHSEETKRKISEAHKKVDKTIQKATLSKLGNQSNPAWRRSASLNRKGKWTITNGLHSKMMKPKDAQEFLRNNPDWYRGMDNNRKEVLRDNNTSGKTAQGLQDIGGILVSEPELAVLRIIQKYIAPVESSHLLRDPTDDYYHVYDYYIPSLNILGEFDGDYWHRDQDYDNDPRRIHAVKSGFRYFVIKESEYYTAKSKHEFVQSVIQSIID